MGGARTILNGTSGRSRPHSTRHSTFQGRLKWKGTHLPCTQHSRRTDSSISPLMNRLQSTAVVHPELIGKGRCMLVVVAIETESVEFIRQLAFVKAREVPKYMRWPTILAWQRRWARMLATVCSLSFTASLVEPESQCDTWCTTDGEAPQLADLFGHDARFRVLWMAGLLIICVAKKDSFWSNKNTPSPPPKKSQFPTSKKEWRTSTPREGTANTTHLDKEGPTSAPPEGRANPLLLSPPPSRGQKGQPPRRASPPTHSQNGIRNPITRRTRQPPPQEGRARTEPREGRANLPHQEGMANPNHEKEGPVPTPSKMKGQSPQKKTK